MNVIQTNSHGTNDPLLCDEDGPNIQTEPLNNREMDQAGNR